MQIELKNIKFSESLSEETNAFVADVYVNKVKVAYVKNDGKGGSTDYYAYEGKRELVLQVETFCKSLPPIRYDNFELKMNFEHKIDQLFEEWLKTKNELKLTKRLLKDMLIGLCLETPNGYSQITWKNGNRKVTISELLSVSNGRNILKTAIANAKAEGKKVLNINIPLELF